MLHCTVIGRILCTLTRSHVIKRYLCSKSNLTAIFSRFISLLPNSTISPLLHSSRDLGFFDLGLQSLRSLDRSKFLAPLIL
jgi:hypothetical protein